MVCSNSLVMHHLNKCTWKWNVFMLGTAIIFLEVLATKTETTSKQEIPVYQPTEKDSYNDTVTNQPLVAFTVGNSTELPDLMEFNNDTVTEIIDISYVDLTSESNELQNTTTASQFASNEVASESLWTSPAYSNASVSVTETATAVPVLFEATKTMKTDDVIVSTTWFVLTLDGNCSLEGDDLNNLQDSVHAELARRLQTHRRNLHIQNTSCSSPDQMDMNVTVTGSCSNLSSLLAFGLLQHADESGSGPLVRIEHHDYYVDKIRTADGDLLKVELDVIPVDMRHSDVELIIYIAVGSACAFLVLLAAGLLAYKYCATSQKPANFFVDYQRDVSHGSGGQVQNMHLEDYTLTRIPRPKLAYVDYYRGMSLNNNVQRYSPLDEKSAVTSSSANGIVQPHDTSVVPLEDASQCRDEVIVRPMDIRRYGQGITTFYRNGRGIKSPAKRDSNGTNWQGFYQARSDENLQRDDVGDRRFGLDNPTYQ